MNKIKLFKITPDLFSDKTNEMYFATYDLDNPNDKNEFDKDISEIKANNLKYRNNVTYRIENV